ncbi:MAG: hypothetical protein A3D47_01955 [Candidatus Colwellbacteria bacterium RIFCSPHIGHO2_02_FULL_43_15]|uniref:HTH deoR-type domain-containing protein n=2 Tax=Candidatus Colwelliibacteriota TaxID=1817904 RepID=A0A1G1Z020_9BACT|nr:MAG: hypothetical protein A3D47_01955 [Candidatus Colwellbacteria bacterium RIFCSPHIGHO2_02_FULL_43_15]OGY60990.1 MAG: hypothetical protein A3F99_00165 [Candidatus Colwellbacteria bacterium RIFCSPLOWO2_12_FULL_43_11]
MNSFKGIFKFYTVIFHFDFSIFNYKIDRLFFLTSFHYILNSFLMYPLLPKSVFDKAYDISFAVFRVVATVNNAKLKSALEDSAVDLILEINDQAVDKLGALVRLATSVNEMKTLNAEVLLRELDNIKVEIQSAISQSAIGNEDEVDLSNSFADSSEQPVHKQEDEEKDIKINSNIANRQSAILSFIRQLPNGCRMRDLIVKFPEVSERTLRNDLHDLTTEGLVERVGSQGPFASFRGVTKKEIIAL